MDSRSSLFSLAIPAVLVLAGFALLLQGEKKPAGQDPGKPGDKAGAMQMPEMPKPTKEHEWLKARAGTWDCTVHMMGNTSKGTETNKMLGDFSVISDFEGNFMGMPFKGHAVMTYDPMKKKYVSTWSDSTAPFLMLLEGTADADGKKLTMKGMGPNMENKLVEYTFLTEVKGPDETVFTMFESSKSANDPMVMRIDYKRRK